MAKKKSTKVKGITAAEDAMDEAAAAEWLRRQGVTDVTEELAKPTQSEIDRLFKEAMDGNDGAKARLKTLREQGLIHVPEGAQKPVLGPAPEAPKAAPAPAKPEGKAAKGKDAGKPLPKPTGESEVAIRQRAAAKAAEEAAAQEAAAKAKNAGKSATGVVAPQKEGGTGPKIVEQKGPAIVPKPEPKAGKAVVKTIGADEAQKFRERARARGVDADEILQESTKGVKQLDQLPDNAQTRRYMDRWLEAKAGTPVARSRVRMEENRNKKLAAESPAQKKARKETVAQEKAQARNAARRLPGEQGKPITLKELQAKNFAQMSQENFKSFSDRMEKSRIVMSRVDRQKAAELEALHKSLDRLEGGRPKTLLADELGVAMQKFRDAQKPQDVRRAVNSLAAMHTRFFSGGQVRSGVTDLAKTGMAVRAEMAEEALQARGTPMGAKLSNNPKLFNQRKKALFSDLKRVSGAKTMKELKTLVAEQGIKIDARNVRTQKGLLALLREKDVEQLDQYIKTRKAEIGESATMAKTGRGKKPATTPDVGSNILPGEEVDTNRLPGSDVETPPVSKVETAAASKAAGKMPKARADKLRKVLASKGLTEEGLLAAVNKKATGGPYKRIEDLPEGLDKRINDWVKRAAAAGAKTTPAGATAAVEAADATPSSAKAAAAKTPEPKIPAKAAAPGTAPTRGFAGAGAQRPQKVGRAFRKQAIDLPKGVTPSPTPKAPGTFTTGSKAGALVKYDAELAAKQAAKSAAGSAANVASKASKLGTLGRILGPIGIAFGVYEILSRLKGQSFDRADEERLKIMQALGSVRGSLDEDTQMRQMLNQQNTMINLAGIQRQKQLDDMTRSYTQDREMNNLIRSNQDLLSALAMPSQPSVAELMARM